MKILILVLSYNEYPFNLFMDAQKNTWDSIEVDGVETCYYHGGNAGPTYKEACLNCSDKYELMHWKFKLLLGRVNFQEYDLIFRTNSCSYIDKNRLVEVASKLPQTGCYAGYDNGGYVSGAGIFFSPDILDILQNELTEQEHYAEDVLFGEILLGRVNITGEFSRIDARVEGVEDKGSYHYRFKTSNDLSDRERDIENMIKLHKKIHG